MCRRSKREPFFEKILCVALLIVCLRLLKLVDKNHGLVGVLQLMLGKKLPGRLRPRRRDLFGGLLPLGGRFLKIVVPEQKHTEEIAG